MVCVYARMCIHCTQCSDLFNIGDMKRAPCTLRAVAGKVNRDNTGFEMSV